MKTYHDTCGSSNALRPERVRQVRQCRLYIDYSALWEQVDVRVAVYTAATSPVASWTDIAFVLYMTRGLKHCLAILVSN